MKNISMGDVWEEFTPEEREDILTLVMQVHNKHIVHIGLLPFVSFTKLAIVTRGFNCDGIPYWNGTYPSMHKTILTGALHIQRVANKFYKGAADVLEQDTNQGV
jgi:hypothetical protein